MCVPVVVQGVGCRGYDVTRAVVLVLEDACHALPIHHDVQLVEQEPRRLYRRRPNGAELTLGNISSRHSPLESSTRSSSSVETHTYHNICTGADLTAYSPHQKHHESSSDSSVLPPEPPVTSSSSVETNASSNLQLLAFRSTASRVESSATAAAFSATSCRSVAFAIHSWMVRTQARLAGARRPFMNAGPGPCDARTPAVVLVVPTTPPKAVEYVLSTGTPKAAGVGKSGP